MAALRVAPVAALGRTRPSIHSFRRHPPRPRISCIGWDPEGILGPPQGGLIARMEFKRRLEKDADAREAFNRQVREEQERRRAQRQARVVPDTIEGLVEYFLDTEARELEIEIARLRPRLNKEFFDHLQLELGQLRFAVSRTKEMEDRIIELEAMQKVLLEGTEAYDKMQTDLVLSKQRLMKILQSKDRKTTLLEMVERNELNRSVLALLDENIASAVSSGQKEAAAFMESVRSSILKYLTCPSAKRSAFVNKPFSRKKRSSNRQQSLGGRGKPKSFLQVAKQQEAVRKVKDAKILASEALQKAIHMRSRAQMYMANAELAAYKSVMALRIAEAKRVTSSNDFVSSILD